MAFDFLTYALCRKSGGSGSIPADYTQVKQNVEKNTKSIEELISAVQETNKQVDTLQTTVEQLNLDNVITTENLSEKLNIQIGDEAAKNIQNNTITIPLATQETPGLVKLAAAYKENGVSADEKSELTVNSLNLDKVIQDENSSLILESN